VHGVALAGGIEGDETGARLEGVADQPLAVDREFADVLRGLEPGGRGLRIAGLVFESRLPGTFA
jgi:hypothetical protein